jgi:hypothetical protein
MQNRAPLPPEQRSPLPDFTPVPRRYRHDGWTPERQRAFVAALAETGSVKHAAERVNMAKEGAYQLRLAAGSEGFRKAWAAALDFGVQSLTDLAIDRAREGVPVPIFHNGEQVGERRWYNDRLLMFILKHHMPSRYGAELRPGTSHIKTLRREWEREQRAERLKQDEAAGLSIDRKAHTLRVHFLRRIAPDPAKRAAWELLAGPVPWDGLVRGEDVGDMGLYKSNMTTPSTILLLAGIAFAVEEDDRAEAAAKIARALAGLREAPDD